MKRFIAFAICLFNCFFTAYSQLYTPAPENLAARKDFQDMKFGMFIHWGASSVLGSGEWVMNNRNINTQDVSAEYVDLQSRLKTKLEVKQRLEDILRSKAKTVEDSFVPRRLVTLIRTTKKTLINTRYGIAMGRAEVIAAAPADTETATVRV